MNNGVQDGFHYEVDFEYIHDEFGDVNVEATFWVEQSKTGAESDWDAAGCAVLEQYKVFQHGEMIEADVPYSIMTEMLHDKFRALQIENEMNINEGF